MVYIQSGGPTSVINTSFYGAIKEAMRHKDQIDNIYGSCNGVEGLIYDKLVEYYNPTCYNEVAPRTDDEKKQKAPIKYSNKFALTNHNGKSKAVYYCTEKTQEETRGYITNISKTNKQITLTNQPTYNV